MTGNDFMAWVLRSPFHGMLSANTMLITVTGRKTGKKYVTPVGYYREDDSLWIVTSRNRTWWRNVGDNPVVDLLLKRKPVTGFAEIKMEQTEVEARLCDYIQHIPQAARGFGIRMENGNPNGEDISRTAKDRLFVKIQLA
jgi:deazaflavin-dependent oxidoreductase (nitroreductase family)